MMMIPTCVLALSILAALLHEVTTLRMVDLTMPSFIIRGQPARLECHYDLEGFALYSVKWFKNNQEFFRFLPQDDPPAQPFSLRGVYVDLPQSSDTTVMLRAVDVDSTGEYRCEVSGEGPSFPTLSLNKTMVVVDLPDASGPQIEGVRQRYQIGDWVRANCTSSRSRPAAQLFWYINQEPADEMFLQYYPILLDEDGFQTSMLGLEFRIRQKHLEKGDLKLKCLATIDTLYWRSNEQNVEGDRPQKAPVLESRGTLASGTSSSSGTRVKESSSILSSSFRIGLATMKQTIFALISLLIIVLTHYYGYYMSSTGTTSTVLMTMTSFLVFLAGNFFNQSWSQDTPTNYQLSSSSPFQQDVIAVTR